MANDNEVIKAGICSFGMSGQVFHAPFLDCMEEFELTAVVERHEKKAAQKYPKIRSYDSVEAMLEDDTLELIIVNTPNTTHYDYVIKALKAGKHVIVEKPFAPTVERAEEMIRLADQKGRLLVTFQNRRWDSDFLAVKEVIEKKLLGELIEAEIHYDRYRMEPSPKKHKEKPSPGVGLIFDLGPHIIDQAIVLFGKPEAVFARIQSHRPDSLVDDYFSIQLIYPNLNCNLKASLLVREAIPAYVLHGTLGSFHKSRADIQEDVLKAGESPCSLNWGEEPADEQGLLHTVKKGVEIRERFPTPKGDYREFYRRIFKRLRKGQHAPVSLNDSLLNTQIIEAAIESQRTKTVIILD